MVHEREQLRSYECDGLMNHRVIPDLVVLPESAEHVQRIVRVCYEEGIPFVARGSGLVLQCHLYKHWGILYLWTGEEKDDRG